MTGRESVQATGACDTPPHRERNECVSPPPSSRAEASLRAESRDLGRGTSREIPPLRSFLATVGMTGGVANSRKTSELANWSRDDTWECAGSWSVGMARRLHSGAAVHRDHRAGDHR